MSKRPEAVECEDFRRVGQYAHGAPLLVEGKMVAGRRDASFLSRPDVHSIKANHIVVASHRYSVGGGIAAPAAACDPVNIMIYTDILRDPSEVVPQARCRRPGCRELFAKAIQAADA
ncbi:hypothetical protein ACFV27_37420 [Streptomyces antimycoticus]|uniref:hypothetical protein n=1 Tax=Streptomyces antimycoticus TaxID=68175 RepID=UPI0036A86FCD